MTAVLDPLLFKNYIESGLQEERILTFARLLNGAFEQFQKLWNEYSKSLKLSTELESSLSSVRLKLQSLEQNSAICATCTKCKEYTGIKGGNISDDNKTGTTAVHIDSLISKETSKEESNDGVLIFSQDHVDESMEETSSNASMSPLKEVQNIVHKRIPSPIVGSHRRNGNAIRRKFSDDFHSTNYMRELSNCTRTDTSGMKVRPTTATIQKSITSLPSEWHSNVSSKLTNASKLGICTTQNVRTELMLGTKRKLKQSQLLLTSEKIIDLSCEEDSPQNKTDMCRMSSKPKVANLATESHIRENNSHSKHEQINLASIQEKSSKIREDVTETERNKWLIPSVKDLIRKTGKNSNRREIESQPDTDMTLFEPAETSAQYDYSLLELNEPGTTPKRKILVNSNSSPNGNRKLNKDNTVFIDFMARPKISTSRESECGNKSQVKNQKKKSISPKLPNEACRSDNSEMVGTLSMKNRSKHEFEHKKNNLLNDFDKLPKKQRSPNYVYQGSPVRKKAARAQLNGWSCWECKNYYEAMGLKEDDLRSRQNQCSRHRAKFVQKVSTQKDFWNPEFTNTYHSMCEEDE